MKQSTVCLVIGSRPFHDGHLSIYSIKYVQLNYKSVFNFEILWKNDPDTGLGAPRALLSLPCFYLINRPASLSAWRPDVSRLASHRYETIQIVIGICGAATKPHVLRRASVADVCYTRADPRQRFEGANGRSRELTLATRCQTDARQRCVQMALIKVHGEIYCGAHRLPDGKTAAKRKSAGVLRVRQRNYSKIDNCNCPRH
ncbi:MAG: hypothetical protein AB1704_21860 [Pseudomonadota bacterium]|uniref:hypothetical protein n=1 Tax=Burkholderiaceae TaxID=119060 RepID=UPI0010F769F8|nr:hypothetical protein [Burkholderia sp. 4M9327F10]